MNKRAVALYMRLSREDGKAGGDGFKRDESNSIGNQRKLLLDFLKKGQEFAGNPVTQYVDDGFSGTGFERPGFLRMMEDVKKGGIQCVIVKDFSRFGRDYIELGDYIEHIFPFMQVRFISVNDGYDSEDYQGKTPDIDVPFRNLAYSLYSQDISDKVKSSLAARRKKGLYIGSIPPYGYRRDRDGLLEPDEEARAVVQRIYREYLDGTGLTELARKLNGEGVLSPKQYKINKGVLRGGKEKGMEGKIYFWVPTTLRQILRNEIYTGVLSAGAYRNGPLGSGKRVFVPEGERIRVEDAHPAIIEKDTFREVQEKMGTKKKGEVCPFLLKGLVKCGECGRLMVRKKGRFRCRYQEFTEHRDMGSFPEQELEGIVWKAVYVQLELLEEKEEVLKRERELCEKRRKELDAEIKRKRRQTEKKKEEWKTLYQQYRRGEMEKTEYLARKKWEGNRAEEMEQELEGMEAEMESLGKRMEERDGDEVCIGGWLGDERNKGELLLCMVEGVDVYVGKRVTIIWKFQDILKRHL